MYCSNSCSYSVPSYSQNISYSNLERISYSASTYNPHISQSVAVEREDFNLIPSYDGNIEIAYTSKKYTPIMHGFLDENRPQSSFIGSQLELQTFVEEAFILTTDGSFPDDIRIRILDKEEFKKANAAFGGKWNEGIQGFAVNKKEQGIASEIFVRKGELDKVMLTLGHEIGHIMTRPLAKQQNEEAKAFAFSIAWMRKIKEFNIANLQTSISLDAPAQNGLHDVALDFVLKRIQEGQDPLFLHQELSNGLTEVKDEL